MTTALTKGQRRALAILLTILLVTVFYFAFVNPVIAKFAFYREVIADSTFRLARFHAIATTRPSVESRLARLRAQGEESTRQYLVRENPSLAAADLQQRVTAIVGSAGGQIASSQVIQRPPEEGHQPVALRLRITGGSAVLQQVLHALESSRQPLLFIDNVTVRSSPPRRQPDQPEPPEMLDISLDVIGYVRQGAIQ